MRRLAITLLALLLMMSVATGVALAKDPDGPAAWGTGTHRGSDPWTYIEENGQNGIPNGNPDGAGRNRAYYGTGANGAGFGSSFWSYADTKDTTRKTEGSYNAFLGQNGWEEDGSPMIDNLGTYSEQAVLTNETIGSLYDRREPAWMLPHATAVDTNTLALNGTLVTAINPLFVVHSTNTAEGIEISIGDATVDETTALSGGAYAAYADALVTVTYTGLTKGPHGGLGGVLYATTSNKCKTCHAVHRAGGAFKLMRADSADDACSYCHVDDHRHASRGAYGGSSNGIYAQNGHTVGSGRPIPDSTIRQWLEPMTLDALADDTDTNMSWTLRIRRYDSERMKLFVYTSAGSSRHDAGYGSGNLRYGPTLLTCMSCHQPHNATNLVWKPTGAPAGYKLLRSSPSGSMITNSVAPADQPNVFNGRVTGTRYKVTVPEVAFGPANTGHNLGKSAAQPDSQTATSVFTTWTQWKGTGLASTTESVSPEALSVWCADCHNLNIASNGDRPATGGADTAKAFRTGSGPDGYNGNNTTWYGNGRYHADRSHTAGSRYTPCYSCHRTGGDGGRAIGSNTAGWDPDASTATVSTAACNRCHYRANKYALDRPMTDFPHTGSDTSAKLLFDWYNPSGGESLDQVCKYCHNLIGSDM